MTSRMLAYVKKEGSLLYLATDLVVITDKYGKPRCLTHESHHRTLGMLREDARRTFKTLDAAGLIDGESQTDFEQGHPVFFGVDDIDRVDELLMREGLFLPVRCLEQARNRSAQASPAPVAGQTAAPQATDNPFAQSTQV